MELPWASWLMLSFTCGFELFTLLNAPNIRLEPRRILLWPLLEPETIFCSGFCSWFIRLLFWLVDVPNSESALFMGRPSSDMSVSVSVGPLITGSVCWLLLLFWSSYLISFSSLLLLLSVRLERKFGIKEDKACWKDEMDWELLSNRWSLLLLFARLCWSMLFDGTVLVDGMVFCCWAKDSFVDWGKLVDWGVVVKREELLTIWRATAATGPFLKKLIILFLLKGQPFILELKSFLG